MQDRTLIAGYIAYKMTKNLWELADRTLIKAYIGYEMTKKLWELASIAIIRVFMSVILQDQVTYHYQIFGAIWSSAMPLQFNDQMNANEIIHYNYLSHKYQLYLIYFIILELIRIPVMLQIFNSYNTMNLKIYSYLFT